jgi:hypothetical protein
VAAEAVAVGWTKALLVVSAVMVTPISAARFSIRTAFIAGPPVSGLCDQHGRPAA